MVSLSSVARGLGERGALIGIMTGITESTLTNVDHGDESGPSSIGVFQQMTSWGSLAQRTDPAQAAGLFFDRMVHVPDWESIDPWMAALAVQESEFSDGSNYQSHVNHPTGCNPDDRSSGRFRYGKPNPRP